MLQCSCHPVFLLSCLQVNYKDQMLQSTVDFACSYTGFFFSEYFLPRPLSSILHSGARALATPEWSPKPWLESNTLHLPKQQQLQHRLPSKEGQVTSPILLFLPLILLICRGKNYLWKSNFKLYFLLWAKSLVETSWSWLKCDHYEGGDSAPLLHSYESSHPECSQHRKDIEALI